MKTFKYFLECYFHSGTNYDELEKITEMFKKEEKLAAPNSCHIVFELHCCAKNLQKT